MSDAAPTQIDDGTISGDSPTHRLHMMQMKINEINTFIAKLQHRRATMTEKIAKAKENKNVARSLTVDKQFARIVKKIEQRLEGVQDDLDTAADELNKARALFFETSGGEVLILPEEKSNGAS